jgi:hypothetical protein
VSGALELIRAALEALGSATARERLPQSAAKVGETFMRGAELPGTFARGKQFAGTPQGLADQFGVGLRKPIPMDSDLAKTYDYYMSSNPSAVRPEGIPSLFGTLASKRMLLSGNAAGFEPIGKLLDAGLLSNDRDYHVWDTSGLNAGAGEGQRLYGAAFGNLLNRGPEATNVTQGLSGLNQLRRSYNQASALMRDPRLAKQILVSPSQLKTLGVDPGYFHGMDPTQQVGALQLAGAQGALTSMKNALEVDADRVRNPYTDPTWRTNQRQRSVDMYGIAAPAFFNPSSSMVGDPTSAKMLANAYQMSPLSGNASIGPRTLTKLGIVQGALGGTSFDDLANRFQGLEYRRGGSVTAQG